MMHTLNFETSCLFVRCRCFKLVEMLVVSVLETNFVLKFCHFRPKIWRIILTSWLAASKTTASRLPLLTLKQMALNAERRLEGMYFVL